MARVWVIGEEKVKSSEISIHPLRVLIIMQYPWPSCWSDINKGMVESFNQLGSEYRIYCTTAVKPAKKIGMDGNPKGD